MTKIACCNMLSNELKLLIWEMALHSLEPQNITIDRNDIIQSSRTSIPSMFHIDSHSRFVALRGHVLIGIELSSSSPSQCVMLREYTFSEIDFKPLRSQDKDDFFIIRIRDQFPLFEIGDQFETSNENSRHQYQNLHSSLTSRIPPY